MPSSSFLINPGTTQFFVSLPQTQKTGLGNFGPVSLLAPCCHAQTFVQATNLWQTDQRILLLKNSKFYSIVKIQKTSARTKFNPKKKPAKTDRFRYFAP
jgi:hypothetical protein